MIGDGGPDLLFSSMSGDIQVRTPHRGAPMAPTPPTPPTPPMPVTPPTPPIPASLDPQQQLDVLRALERGEIDVDEATRRLAGNA